MAARPCPHWQSGATRSTITQRLPWHAAESVVGLYKNECVKIDGPFKTVDELELATLYWMHWFNEHRLHSSIGYLTPIEIEQQYREMNSRQQPLSGELALH